MVKFWLSTRCGETNTICFIFRVLVSKRLKKILCCWISMKTSNYLMDNVRYIYEFLTSKLCWTFWTMYSIATFMMFYLNHWSIRLIFIQTENYRSIFLCMIKVVMSFFVNLLFFLIELSLPSYQNLCVYITHELFTHC